MKLISLTLHRFGSFSEATTFKFPEHPGLYFMRGVNRAEPRLDANGTGKSTIWAALTWLLFERTVKGLRAGDVCTWGHTGGTSVSLVFEHDGGHYVMERTWGPNSWTLTDLYEGITDTDTELRVDLTKHPDNPVLTQLRLHGLATWLQTVVIASGEPMFLDLKPEAKTQFMSDVLGLDQWDERASKASKEAQRQDEAVRRLESAVARLEGKVAALARDGHGEEDERRWVSDHAYAVTELHGEYEQVDRSRHAAEVERNKERALLQEQQEQAAEARRKCEPLADKYERAKKLFDEADVLLKSSRQELNHAADTGRCPTCGHTWSAQDRKEAEKELRENEAKVQELRVLLKQRSDELAPLYQRVTVLEGDIAVTQRAIDRLDADLRHYDHQLDRIAEQADKLAKQTNPFAQARDRHLQELDDARHDLARAEQELDDALARYRMLAMWATEFKAIRLQQMEEALQQLEIEVASECAERGLVGWSLLFSLDKVSKRGTVSRGFTVTVLSPHNAEAVPWESWSGGEKQRLRLAAQAGLAELVRARMGVTLPLEVWDEPTQGLSAKGITDLLDCLALRAQREQRQIWVVDHHSLGYGGFDGVVTVAREQKGSTLET